MLLDACIHPAAYARTVSGGNPRGCSSWLGVISSESGPPLNPLQGNCVQSFAVQRFQRIREHRSGKSVSTATNGAVVCVHCHGFIVLGERGPRPTFCSGRCRVASWRARRGTVAFRDAHGRPSSRPGR